MNYFLPPIAFTINTTIITITIIATQMPALKPAPKIPAMAWQLLSDAMQKNKMADNANEKRFMILIFK